METEVRKRLRFEDAMLLTLKTEEQGPNQGMQAASSSWKSQESGFSPRVSRSSVAPAKTLISAHWNLFQIPDLQSCETFVLFEATKHIVICYSNNRKL